MGGNLLSYLTIIKRLSPMAGFTPPYPSDQHNDASAVPVRIVSGATTASAATSAISTVTPLGFQSLSVGSTAVGLTVPAGATMARVNVGTGTVLYRDDGTAPTATVGFPVAGVQSFDYAGDLSAIKFIASSTTAVQLSMLYYK